MTHRVLIVDDSPVVRAHIIGILQRETMFDAYLEASDGLSAFREMSRFETDFVICDLVMPGSDGLKLLALMRARPELCQIPVLVLTSEADAARKADILERGASDYVTKPFHEKELVARVRVHHRLKLLQDELRRANRKLEDLAMTDPLTGVLNRRAFEVRLREELARRKRYRHALSLVMVDMDHFKSINDVHGHAAGDAVLRQLGALLLAESRGTDSTCRFGGEEFLLLLPETGASGARRTCERLRTRVLSCKNEFATGSVQVTASFGFVALESPNLEDPTAERLFVAVDAALYRAKENGRNRVEEGRLLRAYDHPAAFLGRTRRTRKARARKPNLHFDCGARGRRLVHGPDVGIADPIQRVMQDQGAGRARASPKARP